MARTEAEDATVIDPNDMARMKAILRKEATGYATVAEQDELYGLVEKYVGPSRVLPWEALLKVAQYGVRLYGQEDEAPQAA
jgi:hypothetical protein